MSPEFAKFIQNFLQNEVRSPQNVDWNSFRSACDREKEKAANSVQISWTRKDFEDLIGSKFNDDTWSDIKQKIESYLEKEAPDYAQEIVDNALNGYETDDI